MYSVLLVEDEALELETLKHYVDWNKLGIDKVYTARSSRSALACIAEHEPDILFADIQMPGMSGIDLAKTIREEGSLCKIVFLTGYDKFEYAKAAVQVHAEEYLLKPFQIEEVEALTRQLVEKIRKERETASIVKSQEGKALEDLCLGKAQRAPSAFQKELSQSPGGFGVCAFYGLRVEQKRRLQNLPEVIHAFSVERLFLVLLSSRVPILQFIKKILEREEGDFRGVYAGSPVKPGNLSACTSAMLRSQDALFFGTERKFYELQEAVQWKLPADTPFQTSRREILEAVCSGSEQNAAELLKTYLSEYKGAGREGCVRSAYGLFLYLKDSLHEETASNPVLREKFSNIKEPELLSSMTYGELEARFLAYLFACSKLFQGQAGSYYINWVKQYVDKNYASACSVEDMAEKMGLSPNYLRKKFKDGTGSTILEYVTKVRLDAAEKLLRQHNLKVKEVSQRVGYENVSYFIQLFVKKNGVTPNEYKNMVH